MTQKILGYFCDFNSVAAAFGADTSGTTDVSTMTFTPEVISSKTYVGGTRDYAQFTFTPVQQLMCKFLISKTGWNNGMQSGAKAGTSTAKFISFYNSAGVVLFSFGFKPSRNSADYPDAFRYSASVTQSYGRLNTDGFLGLFAYNDATHVYTAADYVKYVDVLRNYGGNFADCNFNVTIKIALDSATPANSAVLLYINGILCCQLSAGVLGTNSPSLLHDVAKVTINEIAHSTSYSNNGIGISNFVLATEVDESITPEVNVFAGFGAVNNFTGALANITESKQDANYIATSAELSQKCQILLGSFSKPTIEQLDLYLFARYVQAGGVSCQFSLSVKTQTGNNIGTPVTVNITANTGELKYQTKLVASYVNSLVTSGKITAAELTGAYIEIEIVGV